MAGTVEEGCADPPRGDDVADEDEGAEGEAGDGADFDAAFHGLGF